MQQHPGTPGSPSLFQLLLPAPPKAAGQYGAGAEGISQVHNGRFPCSTWCSVGGGVGRSACTSVVGASKQRAALPCSVHLTGHVIPIIWKLDSPSVRHALLFYWFCFAAHKNSFNIYVYINNITCLPLHLPRYELAFSEYLECNMKL